MILSEYSRSNDVKSLNKYLSVTINVHNNGDVLEIVGMCCKLTVLFIQLLYR